MSLYKSFYLIILFAILAWFPYSIAAQEAITKEFLSSMLTKEIENYHNKFNIVHHRGEWKRTTTKDKKKLNYGRSYETDFQPGMFRTIVNTDYKDKSVKGASGVNSQYSFRILHSSNGWYVKDFDFLEKEDEAKNELIRKDYKRMETSIKSLPYYLNLFETDGTIEKIVQDKNFEILKSESVLENAKNYRKIFFKFQEKKSEGVISNSTGSITFDPDLAWAIKYGEINSLDSLGEKLNKTVMFEYEMKKDLPLLKSRKEHVVIYDPKTKEEVIMDLNFNFSTKLLDKPLPESEFTLSHFGLPEPIGANFPKPPTPPYIWLLRIAGGLAILSFCFYLANKIVNRKKKNTSI